MKLTVSNGGVAPGSYYADFVGVKEVTNDYGAGLQWEWRVAATGQAITRITQDKPTPKNACGRILAGLTGSALAIGGEIDLDRFIGKRYIVIVAQTKENGSSRVESVSPMPMQSATPAEGQQAAPTATQSPLRVS